MVQCKDCGLLAIRTKEIRELQEVLEDHRNETLEALNLPHGDSMICSASQRARFPVQGMTRVEQLHDEITCKRFVKHHPGLTPKEHFVMDLFERWDKKEKRDRWLIAILTSLLVVLSAILGALLS